MTDLASITSDHTQHRRTLMARLAVACEPHSTGPADERRPAVVLWKTSTGTVGLCESCMWTWWDFARDYPGNLPLDLVPLVGHSPCRCGHPHDVHLHLREGTDCSRCLDCHSYRRTLRGIIRDVRAYLRGPR